MSSKICFLLFGIVVALAALASATDNEEQSLTAGADAELVRLVRSAEAGKKNKKAKKAKKTNKGQWN